MTGDKIPEVQFRQAIEKLYVTGAEWMVIRFGEGAAGQSARSAYALLAVVVAVAFAGFAEYGGGQFLHAFMGHFSATANPGAAYLVRDGYQRLLRPRASDKEQVNASRLASGLVALAIVAICAIVLCFLWYKNLPEKDEGVLSE